MYDLVVHIAHIDAQPSDGMRQAIPKHPVSPRRRALAAVTASEMFLASPDAGYLTGQSIVVDGGIWFS